VATKTTKNKAKAKKTAAPAKKTATAVKVTMKGKTTVKVSPPPRAALKSAQKPVLKAPPAKIPAIKNAAPPVLVKKAEKPEKLDFTAGDFVVYPAHGVGQVEGVEVQTIAGMQITLYTICFEKDRMRLKLPVTKVKASGLRKLSSKDRLKDALATLQGRSQTRRIMWSRRAQEYEAKINSGDPVSIAEVLRDLRKDTDQSEQSYSERQIYQAALERLAREVAAIEKIDEKKAAEKLEAVLSNVA
jgi:CarD family transcriptional regulator